MVTLVQPDPQQHGLLVRFVDYPFEWLDCRHTPRGYLGDLVGELRAQWHAQGRPTGEALDRAWVIICLDTVARLNTSIHSEYDPDLGLVHWSYEPSTSSNDVGAFIHYDYGMPSDD